MSQSNEENLATLRGGSLEALRSKNAFLVAECAAWAHEVNRAHCIAQGDHSQVPWTRVPSWQKESVFEGVVSALDLSTTPRDSHDAWASHKRATGWVYGSTKDADAKTHPCLVPYEELPEAHRVKNVIFLAVVRATAMSLGMLPDPAAGDS